MSAEPTPDYLDDWDDLSDPAADLRRRFTVDEYEYMGQVAILKDDDRVELLDGEIVNMTPIGPVHAGAVTRIAELFFRRLAGRALVIVQNPLRLAPHSEPQPDIVIARRRDDYYQLGHPTAEDVLLVIEVGDSSLRLDRKVKVPLYASANVPELWLVNCAGVTVTTYAEPEVGAYGVIRTARVNETLIPRMLPDLEITVREIFGITK